MLREQETVDQASRPNSKTDDAPRMEWNFLSFWDEVEARAWATVNKTSGDGNQSGSGNRQNP